MEPARSRQFAVRMVEMETNVEITCDVGEKVKALAAEWSPILARDLAARHSLPLESADSLAQAILVYVGIAAVFIHAHEHEVPRCDRGGHPYSCAAALALERADRVMVPAIADRDIARIYRKELQDLLVFWVASHKYGAMWQALGKRDSAGRKPVSSTAA